MIYIYIYIYIIAVSYVPCLSSGIMTSLTVLFKCTLHIYLYVDGRTDGVTEGWREGRRNERRKERTKEGTNEILNENTTYHFFPETLTPDVAVFSVL